MVVLSEWELKVCVLVVWVVQVKDFSGVFNLLGKF